MSWSISEMARLTGVSVRTLHYYDQIGLLRPQTSDAGYRRYREADVERMQQILFYRELEFPLKDIRAILADPQYDKSRALAGQRKLLVLKRERLDRLLALLDANLKGEQTMEFQGFDRKDYEAARRQYAQEAHARWGGTAAWEESRAREAARTPEDRDGLAEEMNAIFRRAAALREGDPAAPEAQALVREWQAFISANYYPCTDEILAGLGQMYAGDPRFQKNLDRFGPGTADFLSAAIAASAEK